MGALAEDRDTLSDLLMRINTVIAEFENIARDQNATKILSFGTEAVRRLIAKEQIRPYSALSRVRVLSQFEEARSSAIAATSALEHHLPPGPCLVIDQGAGSLEVATVELSPTLAVLESTSLDLGGDELLRRFAAQGSDLGRFRQNLKDEISAPFDFQPIVGAFAQGSVATKCAWLSLSPPRGSRYDPKRTHGSPLGLRSLDAMIEIFVKLPYPQWDRMRATFDPANPTSDDIERVVTGAVVLVEILRIFSVSRFIVSANGTRHGVALGIDEF